MLKFASACLDMQSFKWCMTKSTHYNLLIWPNNNQHPCWWSPPLWPPPIDVEIALLHDASCVCVFVRMYICVCVHALSYHGTFPLGRWHGCDRYTSPLSSVRSWKRTTTWVTPRDWVLHGYHNCTTRHRDYFEPVADFLWPYSHLSLYVHDPNYRCSRLFDLSVAAFWCFTDMIKLPASDGAPYLCRHHDCDTVFCFQDVTEVSGFNTPAISLAGSSSQQVNVTTIDLFSRENELN